MLRKRTTTIRGTAFILTYAGFFSAGFIRAEVLIRPSDPGINYYGRFDMSTSSTAVKFNWPGSSIEASFPGPSIGVELTDGGAYFDVEIDSMLIDSLKPSSTTHRAIRTNLSTAWQRFQSRHVYR